MPLLHSFARPFLLLAALLLFSTPAMGAQLTVSAAASLTNVFQELQPLFEKSDPGTTLLFNFAASGPLLKQIESGAPVDVFVSADQETMNQAAAKKLLDGSSRKDFTANTLVMVGPSGQTLALKDAQDLLAAGVVRIAIGNPDSVPAGRYARQSLTAAGLYEKLQPKFVYGESVRQVLDYVGRSEVQAGFVYKTDALIAKDKVTILAVMGAHEAVTYPAAVIAGSKLKKEAARFIAFLTTPEAQAVLSKYGFRQP